MTAAERTLPASPQNSFGQSSLLSIAGACPISELRKAVRLKAAVT
jgi:hypothetical protein